MYVQKITRHAVLAASGRERPCTVTFPACASCHVEWDRGLRLLATMARGERLGVGAGREPDGGYTHAVDAGGLHGVVLVGAA